MVGKKAVLMLVLLSLGLLAVTFQPAKSVKRATIDFEGLKAETFVYNVFLPLVSKDYEENNTVIDFEGLAEGDIVRKLSHGAGISGDPINGNVTVNGYNPDPKFKDTNAAMIFDATCAGGCSGGDDDLYFPELGNGLIISEDLDSSDPDDADNPGDFYFEFVFSNFGNAKVNLKKLTYADIDDNEAPGLIEVYKGSQLKKEMELPHTGNQQKEEVLVEANDIDRLVVRFNGSAMIDNVEIVIEPPNYNMTIGYEDLRFVSGSDFDYNDWVVSDPLPK